MIKRTRFALALLIAAGGLGGCLMEPGEDAEDIGEVEAPLIIGNGIRLNGVQMNGIEMNGVEMNGVEMNGVEMNGVEMNGTVLSGFRADNGAAVTGAGFIGATLIGAVAGGEEISLRIDDIEPTADPEIQYYTVAYWSGTSWAPLCGQSGGDSIQAIPLAGRWDYSAGTPTGGSYIDDPSMFTFACLTGALAKCTLLGYKPWKMVEEETSDGEEHDVPLRALHQACTRMIRADYCGDGVAHTQNGTPINTWDDFDIQKRDKVKIGWYNEAEWTPAGAACISNLRYDPLGTVTAYVNFHCPARATATYGCFSKQSTFFTAHGYATPLDSRSLLRDEFDYFYTSTH
jgi:hypothetical protein